MRTCCDPVYDITLYDFFPIGYVSTESNICIEWPFPEFGNLQKQPRESSPSFPKWISNPEGGNQRLDSSCSKLFFRSWGLPCSPAHHNRWFLRPVQLGNTRLLSSGRFTMMLRPKSWSLFSHPLHSKWALVSRRAELTRFWHGLTWAAPCLTLPLWIN